MASKKKQMRGCLATVLWLLTEPHGGEVHRVAALQPRLPRRPAGQRGPPQRDGGRGGGGGGHPRVQTPALQQLE